MSTARLTSAMLVGAIRRLAERAGGFAMVVANGDQSSGAILLEMRERGVFTGVYERMPSVAGGTQWQKLSADAESLSNYLSKRLNTDPDLTIIELDVPDATQFIPQLPSGT